MCAEHVQPPVGPSVDELVAAGGWTIEDPRRRRELNPETFWLPDDQQRAAIRPGSQVKLLLWFIDQDGPDQRVAQCERMWTLVEARDVDVVRGRLTSPPCSAQAALEMGELIQFRPTDAIDVLDPEDDWHDHRSFLRAMFEGDEAFEEWKRAHPHMLKPRAGES